VPTDSLAEFHCIQLRVSKIDKANRSTDKVNVSSPEAAASKGLVGNFLCKNVAFFDPIKADRAVAYDIQSCSSCH
jgi:hypothetical protein